jgi:membrane protease YdiL (CAAX protease family)
VAILCLAARVRKWTITDYLALNWPNWRQLGLGGVALILALIAISAAEAFSGDQTGGEFTLDLVRSARDGGTLPLLLITVALIAPIGEEVLFRGFMLRGLATSFLRPWGAILVTSLLWAAMHTQYSLFYMSAIVFLGFMLGWLRWRTGSTTLTILVHMLFNGLACFGALLSLGES